LLLTNRAPLKSNVDRLRSNGFASSRVHESARSDQGNVRHLRAQKAFVTARSFAQALGLEENRYVYLLPDRVSETVT